MQLFFYRGDILGESTYERKFSKRKFILQNVHFFKLKF